MAARVRPASVESPQEAANTLGSILALWPWQAHWAAETPVVEGSLAGLVVTDGRLPGLHDEVAFDDDAGTRYHGTIVAIVSDVYIREHGEERTVRHVTIHVDQIRRRFHGVTFQISDGPPPRLAADGGKGEAKDEREDAPRRIYPVKEE